MSTKSVNKKLSRQYKNNTDPKRSGASKYKARQLREFHKWKQAEIELFGFKEESE